MSSFCIHFIVCSFKNIHFIFLNCVCVRAGMHAWTEDVNDVEMGMMLRQA